MTIALGSDHRGYEHKEFIKKHATYQNKKITWLDVGTDSHERTDYPEYAIKVCNALGERKAEYGALLCGTGVGMAVAANRFEKIYAGLAWNEEIARLSKKDDNINVLVLPADYVTPQQAVAMVDAWLNADFNEGRYRTRIAMIDAIR